MGFCVTSARYGAVFGLVTAAILFKHLDSGSRHTTRISIKLIQSTTQATKLRPVISVTSWILPPGHEFPHCQFHPFFHQKSDLEFHQVNGLGVDFAGMERAALSTALTQVAAESAVLMLNK